MNVHQLKKILAEHDDKDEVELGLVFKQSSSSCYADKLEKKLKQAYDLLLESMAAVKYAVRNERKTKQNMLYYEGKQGYNVGARGLIKDIEKFVNTYSEFMLRAQIEN